MRLPVPRWFPPLSRNHPVFFVSYSFTIILNIWLAFGGLLGADSSFRDPYLRYVRFIPEPAWGAAAVVIALLLLVGFHPRYFQVARAGFALGFTVWFARSWLIILARIIGNAHVSPFLIGFHIYGALMHLPQGLEPPLNPQTWVRE